MTEKLLVPDIGEFEGVEVIEILVQEGQEIKKNDPIVTIESDKSSVEIPSTIEGKIETVNVKIGDKVSKGDLLLTTTGTKISTKSQLFAFVKNQCGSFSKLYKTSYFSSYLSFPSSTAVTSPLVISW